MVHESAGVKKGEQIKRSGGVRMAKKPTNYMHFKNRYVCYECSLTFIVYGVMKDKRYKTPFCPNCGEYYDVQKEKSTRTRKKGDSTEKAPRITWTDEENKVIDECIAGKMTPGQVQILTGRSIGSIYRRKSRRIKELKEKEKNDKQNSFIQ